MSSCHDFFEKVKDDISDNYPALRSSLLTSSEVGVENDKVFVRTLKRVFSGNADLLLKQLPQKNYSQTKDFKFLLQLSSIDKIIEQDSNFFISEFLTPLLESCPNLTIMIGSYEFLEFLPPVSPVTMMKVEELDRLSSVELFMETAGTEVQEREVFELVKQYQGDEDMFDFTNIIPNL